MDFHDENTDPFDEILRSIKASSHDSCLKEEPPSHDFHNKVNQKTDAHQAGPVEFYPSITDTFPPSVFNRAHSGVFSPNLTSSFGSMITPNLAIEPPPPPTHGHTFHFMDISNASRGIARSQTGFEESPLKTSLEFQNDRGMFHSSPTELFSSSPNSSPGALTAFPLSSHNLYGDHVPFTFPKEFGVPIARSNIKGQPGGITGGRKAIRHQRDFSGTSSTTSTVSGLSYDVSPAIDPSALQHPLSKVQTELVGLMNNDTSHIISPFINQVVEQRPDGTITGRYSRPLTSTGRPSHARKTPPGHVKRPRNAFILFRSYACSSNLIPPSVEKDHRQISRIVSHMWKSLAPDERAKWERQAEEEKDLHRKLHPDYRYKPIYRKENFSKKKQARLGSSSASKKKGNSRKNAPLVADCGDFSQESENCSGLHEKTSADLRRERDEEIRCEAVAKVLMETKLSGMILDEVQMEERVLEQVRLVKTNDAQQSQIQPPSEIDNHNPDRASCPNGRNKKPKNKLLTPLQGRRKSVLNRSNSAPPPPSPLRMMDARDVVYNPKARGNRELSPDFPKLKLLDQEEDMSPTMAGEIPSEPGNFTHPAFYPPNFHSQFRSENEFHPLIDSSIRNSGYHHHQFTLSSPEDYENLFPAPDFTFPGEHCFRPQAQQNDVAHAFFNAHMSQTDIHNFNDGDYSSKVGSPLTAPTEQVETGGDLNDRDPRSDDKVGQKDSMKEDYVEKDSVKGLMNGPNIRRTSLNIFTPSMRRRSSLMMTFSDVSNPGLVEALEIARKNATSTSENQDKWGDETIHTSNRRESVVVSGLGEFPVMNLNPSSVVESAQMTIVDHPWLQLARKPENTSGCGPDQIPQAYATLSGTQGSEMESFAEYIDSFETTEAITFDSAIGQDGQTYLFLTREQAETDGLIAQILDAGYGVTYEADVPEGEA
ncbi:hypothetical protein PCASD_15231 [Puccinia coronata f. sp. avenae]|uniref:HMG box domain-containing protein n=2 Tax=Puccinia coronata f. sp. avenae TaxID=200324 RepID=A0A2N5T1G3_9BASI|nr:hypothetical protein PCASD_15231 [Puccinia coronata f. sp. avenae]